MRIPRKLKKAIKNSTVIYDVSTIPCGMDFDTLWEGFKSHGVLIYDSSKGNPPEFVNRVGNRVNIVNRKKI